MSTHNEALKLFLKAHPVHLHAADVDAVLNSARAAGGTRVSDLLAVPPEQGIAGLKAVLPDLSNVNLMRVLRAVGDHRWVGVDLLGTGA